MTTQVSPRPTINSEQVTTIVETACRAPSLHNSQPWRWEFADGALRLFADHHRVGHHTDITGNEVILSCGAALDHLQVAAAGAGWRTEVQRYPDPHDPDCLAAITFSEAATVSAHEHDLSDAIRHRHTDRLAFAAPEPWADLLTTLATAVAGTPVTLSVIDDSGRPALADASRRTEEHRRDDASYRYELLWWTHHSAATEGMPPTALPSEREAARVDVARDFPGYGTGDRTDHGVARDRSKILVLSTYDDSHLNVLRCGEALSRLLLECTVAGLATCVLTHMMEVHAAREDIRRIAGVRGEPQVLVRVGTRSGAESTEPLTGRRPVSEVLHVA